MTLKNWISSAKGQSVFEILIAVTIATLIIGAATTAMIVSMRSGAGSADSQRAYGLANQLLSTVRSFSESNWAELYAHNGNAPYYLSVVSTSTTSTVLGLAQGTSTVVVEGVSYYNSFVIEDVSRNSNNWVAAGYEDPTTLKITAYVAWALNDTTNTIDLSTYISKIRSRTFSFDSWGGSSGVTSAFTGPTTDYYALGGTATITAGGDITY